MKYEAPNLSESNLEELFVASVNGDTNAYHELFTAYIDSILRSFVVPTYLSRYFQKEDMMNDIYDISWRKLHQVSCAQKYSAWLYTVAKHIFYKRIRSYQRIANHETAFNDNSTAEYENAALPRMGKTSYEENQRVLNEILGELPEEDRALIVSIDIEQQRYDEVAKNLGITPDAVRKRRKKILTHLKRIAEKHLNCYFVLFPSIHDLIYPQYEFVSYYDYTTKAGTTSTVYTIIKLVAGILNVLMFHLIWLAAVLVYGNRILGKMILQEPNVPIRKHLFRVLFMDYCGIISIPLILVGGIHIMSRHIYSDMSRTERATHACLTMILLIICGTVIFVLVARRYMHFVLSPKEKRYNSMKETTKSKK